MKLFLRPALACALFLLALTGLALPAYAHDELRSSSPAENAELSAASVTEIELVYTASVKFPFVVLHDAAGKQIPLGKPRLAGPKVLTDVPEPLAPGAYVIAWRVVSSDGHPIEGEIPFRVKGSASAPVSATPDGKESTGGGPSTPAKAGQAPAAASAASSAPVAPAASAGSAGVPGWIWAALAVLAALGAFVLIRTARRGAGGEDAHAD
jgi:methionine-rich copper-binding protein CopC